MTEASAASLTSAPVEVGTKADATDVGPLTTRMFVRYAGASGDFNPMHYDDALARSAGYPSVFAQGMLSAALLASFAVDWLGAENVRRYRVRFREQVWPGDVLTCSGEVTAVEQAADGWLATVELTATRQTGGMAVSATAAFLFPSLPLPLKQMSAQSENETFRREGYGPTSLAVGERGARTRQKIVAETLRLFESQGFHATSVESIAKAAGTSRSTLYQYFESKEQIFVELLDECGTALMRVVRRIGPLGPTRLGFDNLHWWLGEWAYVYDKYATMFVQWATVDTPGASVRPLVTGFTHSYNERIAKRLDASGVTGLAPVDAAVAMTSIVHRFNYFRHMSLTPHRFTAEQLLDGLAVFVQLILFPDTPLEVFDLVSQPTGRKWQPVNVPAGEAAARLPDRMAGLRPRAAATVRSLMDAGARLFAENGFYSTGVDDIVGAAGFARGTFYKYFDEKLDLLLQLTRECSDDMRVLIDDFVLIDPVSAAGPAQLREWLARYMPFQSRYLGIMRAWLEGTSRDPMMLAVVRETTRDMHVASLTVLRRVDRPHPLDPDIAAVIQGGILERMPQAVLEHDPERPDADTVELIAAVMERGLYNSGPASPATA
jgi:AcrR family transcriptional regulator/acyl dehydratase